LGVGQSLPLSIGGGVLVTLILGQLHLLMTRSSGKIAKVESKLTAVEKTTTDVEQRMKVVEARTDAVETTVKHELTERRDALILEMRQLEGLIERLSANFENRLTETSTGSAPLKPQDDAVLRMVKAALKDGRIDLHLQPIVSLPQRRVAFYEGFTRLYVSWQSVIAAWVSFAIFPEAHLKTNNSFQVF